MIQTPPPLPQKSTSPTNNGPVTTKIVPHVSIETIGSDSIGIGQVYPYEIVVKNLSYHAISNVRIDDELANGVRYVGSVPQAELTGDRLTWTIGTLEAGTEKRIRVEVRPTTDGEIRNRATVTLSASVGLRAKITRPKLNATVTGPDTAQLGETVAFQINLSNSGNGNSGRILLQAKLGDGLQHPQGSRIEAELQGLAPGESKNVTLKTIAAKPGVQLCQLTCSVDGTETSAKASVTVLEPTLQVRPTVPLRCMVRSEPILTWEVMNPGLVVSQPAQFSITVPEGLEFLSATEGGTFDSTLRTVVWKLGVMDPNTRRSVSVKCRGTNPGDWVIRGVAATTAKVESRVESTVRIEGLAALTFEVVDLQDIVMVGNETTYEIRLLNQGTSACTNVQLLGILSEGLMPTSVQGPSGNKVQGQQITFEPLPRLGMKADAVYRVKVRGTQPGDMRFRVQLSCDQMKQPIIKEESTQFFKE
jgi:uncharacterized repeat protein (TIGR01451 family)